MKKIGIALVVATFFIGCCGYAQEEKVTEEQAVKLVEEYKAKEEATNAKIKEEESKIAV